MWKIIIAVLFMFSGASGYAAVATDNGKFLTMSLLSMLCAQIIWRCTGGPYIESWTKKAAGKFKRHPKEPDGRSSLYWLRK